MSLFLRKCFIRFKWRHWSRHLNRSYKCRLFCRSWCQGRLWWWWFHRRSRFCRFHCSRHLSRCLWFCCRFRLCCCLCCRIWFWCTWWFLIWRIVWRLCFRRCRCFKHNRIIRVKIEECRFILQLSQMACKCAHCQRRCLTVTLSLTGRKSTVFLLILH